MSGSKEKEKIVTGTESASKESTGQKDSDASGPSRQQWPSFSSVLPATSSMCCEVLREL